MWQQATSIKRKFVPIQWFDNMCECVLCVGMRSMPFGSEFRWMCRERYIIRIATWPHLMRRINEMKLNASGRNSLRRSNTDWDEFYTIFNFLWPAHTIHCGVCLVFEQIDVSSHLQIPPVTKWIRVLLFSLFCIGMHTRWPSNEWKWIISPKFSSNIKWTLNPTSRAKRNFALFVISKICEFCPRRKREEMEEEEEEEVRNAWDRKSSVFMVPRIACRPIRHVDYNKHMTNKLFCSRNFSF